MRILLISNHHISQLWGKAFPFEEAACTISNNLPADAGSFDLIIDAGFEEDASRAARYAQSNIPLCIGSVLYTLDELGLTHAPVARFNHWPGFMERPCIEFFCSNEYAEQFNAIFQKLNLMAVKTADIPGFVSARVVAAVINEAYFAAGEDVSSAQEIDIAMKLGTNYPYGPFEWSNKTGISKMIQLLQKLSVNNHIYQPAGKLLTSAS
jgi:3-hydroxybutyryl-CoA dehydrogenase